MSKHKTAAKQPLHTKLHNYGGIEAGTSQYQTSDHIQ